MIDIQATIGLFVCIAAVLVGIYVFSYLINRTPRGLS